MAGVQVAQQQQATYLPSPAVGPLQKEAGHGPGLLHQFQPLTSLDPASGGAFTVGGNLEAAAQSQAQHFGQQQEQQAFQTNGLSFAPSLQQDDLLQPLCKPLLPLQQPHDSAAAQLPTMPCHQVHVQCDACDKWRELPAGHEVGRCWFTSAA